MKKKNSNYIFFYNSAVVYKYRLNKNSKFNIYVYKSVFYKSRYICVCVCVTHIFNLLVYYTKRTFAPD